MKNLFTMLLLVLFTSLTCVGQRASSSLAGPSILEENKKMAPSLHFDDKIRIREAMRMADFVGDKLWKGISAVPFALILVTDSVEFLLHHPKPTDAFRALPYDDFLKTTPYYRPRIFGKNLLATFPAVGGVNCIVVGTAENTQKSTSAWMVTLLHEHFHQYQYAQPDYYARVNALDLAGEDNTGMWMLNYPYPYADQALNTQYKKVIEKLLSLIQEGSYAKKDINAYLKLKKEFVAMMDENDYKYLSFQLWQEGIARYTEYGYLKQLRGYSPTKEVQSLADFTDFSEYQQDFLAKQRNALETLSLEKHQRVCFYAWGMAEGILYDHLYPNWKDNYLQSNFFMEEAFLEFLD